MFLVDTNVISALAPSKRAEMPEMLAWLEGASPYLYLSVVTAAEVVSGIKKAEREGATTKAKQLSQWWAAITHLYAARILDFDLACAQVAGEMLDAARAHQPGFDDIAIAATARAHRLTVLTRNIRHFAPLGVPVIDPFESLPPLPGS